MIPFTCPHCEHHMELPDEFAGQRATCTRCGIPFATPEAPAETTHENVWADVYGERTEDANATRGPDAYARQGPDEAAAYPQPEATGEIPDWVEERHRESQNRLAPSFWAAAYFLPPAAFIWALFLPRRHPQKRIAIVLPLVWMSVLGGIGFAGAYLTPHIGDALNGAADQNPKTAEAATQQSASDREKEPEPYSPRPGYINLLELKPGEMYRVTKHPVPVSSRLPSSGDGMFNGLTLYQIPVGGIFEIAETHPRKPWYRIIVTDGRDYRYMWVKLRGMRNAGLERVPPPTFGNPELPYSAPIERVF